MDHGSMPGMMSDADLDRVKSAQGPAFDEQFLTMRISHHEGATEMARQETARGADPRAKALAAKIVTGRQAEIATMTELLAPA